MQYTEYSTAIDKIKNHLLSLRSNYPLSIHRKIKELQLCQNSLLLQINYVEEHMSFELDSKEELERLLSSVNERVERLRQNDTTP